MTETQLASNVMQVVTEFQETMKPFNNAEKELLKQREESIQAETLPVEERYSIDNIRKRKDDLLDVEAINRELDKLHADQRQAIHEFPMQNKLREAQGKDRENLKSISEINKEINDLTNKFISELKVLKDKKQAIEVKYSGELSNALAKTKVEYGKVRATWDRNLESYFHYSVNYRETSDRVKRMIREGL